jgi:hypothetical protein
MHLTVLGRDLNISRIFIVNSIGNQKILRILNLGAVSKNFWVLLYVIILLLKV